MPMKTALLLLLLVTGAQAAPLMTLPSEPIGFKPSPGVELATSQCLICHSSQYITTQPVMPRAFWKASVEKMQAKYGAPINNEQVAPLVDYLTRTYGAEKTP